MAVEPLRAEFAQNNDVSAERESDPFAEAFMQTFLEWKVLDEDLNHEIDVIYKRLAFAYEGGKARAAFGGWYMSGDHAAIAALVAFEEIDMILDNQYQTPSMERGREEENALLRVAESLRSVWRYLDRQGFTAVRPFARYVGAVQKSDEIIWG
ncbi:hypothetical protein [Edaphosphingomonas haloaromaticamans]|uniref:Uncharacterized protein n=1 Tax=Edaphosphingomonas haloaromaticamans TaxID=653954 RepID=A0A1S1HL67_9SPHN|nr:hypothetical protein [Sphingomonas haloaromaticamans]OHT22181.1 hypothetical protein BHE75_04205 [Sphingomonas haloaromaticamans]